MVHAVCICEKTIFDTNKLVTNRKEISALTNQWLMYAKKKLDLLILLVFVATRNGVKYTEK